MHIKVPRSAKAESRRMIRKNVTVCKLPRTKWQEISKEKQGGRGRLSKFMNRDCAVIDVKVSIENKETTQATEVVRAIQLKLQGYTTWKRINPKKSHKLRIILQKILKYSTFQVQLKNNRLSLKLGINYTSHTCNETETR